MVHSRKLQRGVMDRSFISKKCCFLKDMTHSDVLKKCIESTWGEKEGKFFLSDGSLQMKILLVGPLTLNPGHWDVT